MTRYAAGIHDGRTRESTPPPDDGTRESARPHSCDSRHSFPFVIFGAGFDVKTDVVRGRAVAPRDTKPPVRLRSRGRVRRAADPMLPAGRRGVRLDTQTSTGLPAPLLLFSCDLWFFGNHSRMLIGLPIAILCFLAKNNRRARGGTQSFFPPPRPSAPSAVKISVICD